ncbi:phosphatidylcholine transfer protein isoform X3 [Alosa sapidissima]|uniref:phosphatidylcholine transfer protein isoform X3 n=1 Tax=Alosa sapidissima TaxID=34773 RepID=UPI001C09160C|nr:phosphatidylcholine transfer protein isoform X3 [Alosa sapidissima]
MTGSHKPRRPISEPTKGEKTVEAEEKLDRVIIGSDGQTQDNPPLFSSMRKCQTTFGLLIHAGLNLNMIYIYVRERKDLDIDGRKIWVILARSSLVSQCAEKSGVIRVKDYKQSLAIESDGNCGTKVFMNYFDNPGGMIPTWLVNWAAKSGVPGFLTDMQKACNNYQNYCKNKK